MQAINTYWRRRITGLFLSACMAGALTTVSGCAALQAFAQDSAREFVGSVDVGRIMSCRGAPDARTAALCVGAAVVKPGLNAIVDALADRLEVLGGGGAGAQMSAHELRKTRLEAEALVDELRAVGAEV